MQGPSISERMTVWLLSREKTGGNPLYAHRNRTGDVVCSMRIAGSSSSCKVGPNPGLRWIENEQLAVRPGENSVVGIGELGFAVKAGFRSATRAFGVAGSFLVTASSLQ